MTIPNVGAVTIRVANAADSLPCNDVITVNVINDTILIVVDTVSAISNGLTQRCSENRCVEDSLQCPRWRQLSWLQVLNSLFLAQSLLFEQVHLSDKSMLVTSCD